MRYNLYYKWASQHRFRENAQKWLSNILQKGRLIPTVLSIVKNERDLLSSNHLGQQMISFREIVPFWFKASDHVSKRCNEPEVFDSICGSNLILINSKLHLAITEIGFNLPTYNIQIQNSSALRKTEHALILSHFTPFPHSQSVPPDHSNTPNAPFSLPEALPVLLSGQTIPAASHNPTHSQ